MTPLIILALIISLAGGVLTFVATRKEDKNYGKGNKNVVWIFWSYFIFPVIGLIIVGLLIRIA